MDTPALALTEVAKLLDAVLEVEPPTEASALLDRALRSLPSKPDLDQALIPTEKGSPSLLDLAKLTVAVGSQAVLPECRATIRWLVARLPGGAEQMGELDEKANCAGRWPTLEHSYGALLKLYQQYDHLVVAEAWSDPADILDPRRELGLDYDALFLIASAELSKTGEKHRIRLAEVHQRLERYAKLNRALESLDEKLNRLQRVIETQAVSIDQLEEALHLLRLAEEARGECPAESQTSSAQP